MFLIDASSISSVSFHITLSQPMETEGTGFSGFSCFLKIPELNINTRIIAARIKNIYCFFIFGLGILKILYFSLTHIFN